MLSTDEYVQRVAAAEGHGKGDEGFLFLSEEQLGSRRGKERPVVGPHVAPQRQLTQVPDETVMEVCYVSCVPFPVLLRCWGREGGESTLEELFAYYVLL